MIALIKFISGIFFLFILTVSLVILVCFIIGVARAVIELIRGDPMDEDDWHER